MEDINKNFISAVFDLIWLLDRGYPKRAAIELVGNRYRLEGQERKILYRGVFDRKSAAERKGKKVEKEAWNRAQKVIIDGYNVLITLQSYLMGKRVFIGMDGFVRDISGVFGRHFFNDQTKKSIEILIQVIKSLIISKNNACEIIIYLDYPVSKSGELADYLREWFSRESIRVKVLVVKSPDWHIINASDQQKNILIASSDTILIDRVKQVMDIPEYVIKNIFKKELLDIEKLLQII